LQLFEALARLVARHIGLGVGNVFLGILDRSSIIAGSYSSAGTACSASTVSPVGPTSAKPPFTTMRCGLPDAP